MSDVSPNSTQHA